MNLLNKKFHIAVITLVALGIGVSWTVFYSLNWKKAKNRNEQPPVVVTSIRRSLGETIQADLDRIKSRLAKCDQIGTQAAFDAAIERWGRQREIVELLQARKRLRCNTRPKSTIGDPEQSRKNLETFWRQVEKNQITWSPGLIRQLHVAEELEKLGKLNPRFRNLKDKTKQAITVCYRKFAAKNRLTVDPANPLGFQQQEAPPTLQ